MIQPTDSVITYLAGLYTIEKRNGLKVPVYTVLTRKPGESIAFIHNRMPVILGKDTVKAWLNSEA